MSFDISSSTGESIPVVYKAGDVVMKGSVAKEKETATADLRSTECNVVYRPANVKRFSVKLKQLLPGLLTSAYVFHTTHSNVRWLIYDKCLSIVSSFNMNDVNGYYDDRYKSDLLKRRVHYNNVRDNRVRHKNKNGACDSAKEENMFNVVSEVNRIVLDKTGTLTSDSVDVINKFVMHNKLDAELDIGLCVTGCKFGNGTRNTIDVLGYRNSSYIVNSTGHIHYISHCNSRVDQLRAEQQSIGRVLKVERFNSLTRSTKSIVEYNNGEIVVYTKHADSLVDNIDDAEEGVRRIFISSNKTDNTDNTDNTNNTTEEIGYIDLSTYLRPSSSQVVQKLLKGGIKVMIVTGDNIQNGVWCCKGVGLCSGPVNVIEVVEGKLVCSTHGGTHDGTRNKGSKRRLRFKDVRKVFERDVAITGEVLEYIAKHSTPSTPPTPSAPSASLVRHIISQLPSIKVVALTTPSTKGLVISLLKEAGEVVGMVGDGVNDVEGMREADFSVGLFRGCDDYDDHDDLDDVVGEQEDDRGSRRTLKEKIGIVVNNIKVKYLGAFRGALHGHGDTSLAMSVRALRAYNSTGSLVDAVKEEVRRNQIISGGGVDLVKLLRNETIKKCVRRDTGRYDTGRYDIDDVNDINDINDNVTANQATSISTYQSINPSIACLLPLISTSMAYSNTRVNNVKSIVSENLLEFFKNGLVGGGVGEGAGEAMRMLKVLAEGSFITAVDDISFEPVPFNKVTSRRPASDVYCRSHLCSVLLQGVVNACVLMCGYNKSLTWHDESNTAVLSLIKLSSGNHAGLKILERRLIDRSAFKYCKNYVSDVVYYLSVVQCLLVNAVNQDSRYSRSLFTNLKFHTNVIGMVVFLGVVLYNYGSVLEMKGFEDYMIFYLVKLTFVNLVGVVAAKQFCFLLE
jgi:hypothetical protein